MYALNIQYNLPMWGSTKWLPCTSITQQWYHYNARRQVNGFMSSGFLYTQKHFYAKSKVMCNKGIGLGTHTSSHHVFFITCSIKLYCKKLWFQCIFYKRKFLAVFASLRVNMTNSQDVYIIVIQKFISINYTQVNLKTYATVGSRFEAIIMSIGFVFVYLLSGYNWGRNLLTRVMHVYSTVIL